MKLVMMTLAALVATTSFASANDASELKRVRELADRKISGQDVKKKIASFENTDGNPCAAEGRTYTVTVSVRKSTYGYKGDTPDPRRVWEEVNTYYISQADLLAGKDLDDTVCME